MEYQGKDGNINELFPDFLIKKTEQEIYLPKPKAERIWMMCGKLNCCKSGAATSTPHRMNENIFLCI